MLTGTLTTEVGTSPQSHSSSCLVDARAPARPPTSDTSTKDVSPTELCTAAREASLLQGSSMTTKVTLGYRVPKFEHSSRGDTPIWELQNSAVTTCTEVRGEPRILHVPKSVAATEIEFLLQYLGTASLGDLGDLLVTTGKVSEDIKASHAAYLFFAEVPGHASHSSIMSLTIFSEHTLQLHVIFDGVYYESGRLRESKSAAVSRCGAETQRQCDGRGGYRRASRSRASSGAGLGYISSLFL